MQLDTAHAPCECTCSASSDAPSTDGGASCAAMPDQFASDGDTVGGPSDSRESSAESFSGATTGCDSDERTARSGEESSSEESAQTDDSLEDQDMLATGASHSVRLQDPAEDTTPTALELAIQNGHDVDTFEASALLGDVDASVYVLPGASNILRAKATVRHGGGRAAVETVCSTAAPG